MTISSATVWNYNSAKRTLRSVSNVPPMQPPSMIIWLRSRSHDCNLDAHDESPSTLQLCGHHLQSSLPSNPGKALPLKGSQSPWGQKHSTFFVRKSFALKGAAKKLLAWRDLNLIGKQFFLLWAKKGRDSKKEQKISPFSPNLFKSKNAAWQIDFAPHGVECLQQAGREWMGWRKVPIMKIWAASPQPRAVVPFCARRGTTCLPLST